MKASLILDFNGDNNYIYKIENARLRSILKKSILKPWVAEIKDNRLIFLKNKKDIIDKYPRLCFILESGKLYKVCEIVNNRKIYYNCFVNENGEICKKEN